MPTTLGIGARPMNRGLKARYISSVRPRYTGLSALNFVVVCFLGLALQGWDITGLWRLDPWPFETLRSIEPSVLCLVSASFVPVRTSCRSLRYGRKSAAYGRDDSTRGCSSFYAPLKLSEISAVYCSSTIVRRCDRDIPGFQPNATYFPQGRSQCRPDCPIWFLWSCSHT